MQNPNDLKTLFIGCHCDDIELGCGGTIAKNPENVHCVVLSQKTIEGDPLCEISEKSLQSLGVRSSDFYDFSPSFFFKETQQIWKILKSYDLDLFGTIITQESDHHQDHRDLFSICNRMFLGKNLLTYSASILSCPQFVPNLFVTLEQSHIEAKLAALKHYYMYQERSYFRKETILANLTTNGVIANHRYAEGFSVKRIVNALPKF